MKPFVTLVLGVCHHLYPFPSLQRDDFFDFGQLLYTLYHEQFHVSHFHSFFKTSSPLLSLSLLKVNLPKMTIKSIESETFRWLVPFHQECLWDLRVHRETAVVPKLRTRMMINKSTDFAVYIWFICNSYRLYRHTYALTHRSIKDNVSIGISSIGRFLGSKARLTLLFLLMVIFALSHSGHGGVSPAQVLNLWIDRSLISAMCRWSRSNCRRLQRTEESAKTFVEFLGQSVQIETYLDSRNIWISFGDTGKRWIF